MIYNPALGLTLHPDDVAWAGKVPENEWLMYAPVLAEALEHGLSFAIGGGFAFSHYSNRWRNTKDLDFYVHPRDRQKFVDLVTRHGYTDYYAKLAYDRSWIYRSFKDPVIIDIIWEMANHRTRNDNDWLSRGDLVQVRGLRFHMLPPEELIWAKLYILQRERSDWGDLLNVIHGSGHRIDWDHLINRIRPDQRLLASLLNVYAWLCPGRAARLPLNLYEKLAIPLPEKGPEVDQTRVRLMDSRDWFGAA